MSKNSIISRWKEYIEELYDDDNRLYAHIHNNGQGPPILVEEVKNALHHIKKERHLDQTVSRWWKLMLWVILKLRVITFLLNDIYNCGVIIKFSKIN